MVNRTILAALACACLADPHRAAAHVVAGARVFPVTLTFDDPGVADEASLPSFTYTRGAADGGTGPTHEVDLGAEFDKTITPRTALILNWGWDVVQQNGSKTQTGFENLVITAKWEPYVNPEHEFVVSLGLIRELGGTGTNHLNGDRFGSTAPTAYFGKGLGDLPIGMLRPLAVSGEFGYTIADKSLKAIQPTFAASGGSLSTGGIAQQFNAGNPNQWAGALSLQYSLPYLQSQVKDVGLRGVLGELVPIVELTWTSPATSPSSQGTTWIAAPGVIWLARWGEIGLEALIPLNRTSGTNVGVVGLVHFFFDDLFPNSIGKPIFN